MSFAGDLQRFTEKLERRKRALFVNAVSHVETSIRKGSPVTGAPGQPVDTGELLNSWQTEFHGPGEASVTTNAGHAQVIEDNVRGAQLRSEVGGFHSVKITRAGWPAIVEHEMEKLNQGDGG